MKKLTDHHFIRFDAVTFSCATGAWRCSYTIQDNITKLEKSDSYIFDACVFPKGSDESASEVMRILFHKLAPTSGAYGWRDS